MNPRQFIKKIIQLYRSARKVTFVHKKIRRGRSHSISSKAEDLLAFYLVKKIKVHKIYIDQAISFKNRKSQVYPDVVITKKGVITSFIDLKMDMGYKRDGLYALCSKQYAWLKKSRGKLCKIRDGELKTDEHCKISKKATYNIVIISDQNINRDKLKEHLTKVKKFQPSVEVFILSKEEHPNTYGISANKLLKKIDVDEPTFQRLTRKLK